MIRIPALVYLVATLPVIAASTNNAAKATAPASVRVTRSALAVPLDLTGVITPADGFVVAPRTEVWTDLVVTNFVPHGTHVSRGDALLCFKRDALAKQVRDLERQAPLKAIELRRAELAFKHYAPASRIAQLEAKRMLQRAEENVAIHREHTEPIEQHKTETSHRRAEQSVFYQNEELKQLQRMYEEDDLTEETEEIILRRQRDTVSNAKALLKDNELARRKKTTVDEPRAREDVELTLEKQKLAFSKSESARPLDLEQKQHEMKQKRVAHKEWQEKLACLKRDHAALTIRAPADGVIYHGRFLNATWDTSDAKKHLQYGGRPSQHVTIMTLVTNDRLRIQAWLPEDSASGLTGLSNGVVTAQSHPAVALPVTLASRPTHPASKGFYLLEFEPQTRAQSAPLVPGLACKVRVNSYHARGALTLPEKCVQRESVWPFRQYATRRGPDGKEQAVYLQTGVRHGGRVEIREGLKEGDEVLAR